MTHIPGRIIRASPGSSSQRETPRLQDARSIRSSIWGCFHRTSDCANWHALSEHVFLMHMLWIEGFTSHTTCSIPGRNRVDRDFLFDRVVITMARSDARAASLRSCSAAARALWMLCVSACPALEKLHIFTARSHAIGVSTVCTSSKSSTPPCARMTKATSPVLCVSLTSMSKIQAPQGPSLLRQEREGGLECMHGCFSGRRSVPGMLQRVSCCGLLARSRPRSRAAWSRAAASCTRERACSHEKAKPRQRRQGHVRDGLLRLDLGLARGLLGHERRLPAHKSARALMNAVSCCSVSVWLVWSPAAVPCTRARVLS